MLPGPQMKALIEVKFCSSPLQQDGLSKQVLWKFTELTCAVLSIGKVEMSLASMVGLPFFMCLQRAYLGFSVDKILLIYSSLDCMPVT